MSAKTRGRKLLGVAGAVALVAAAAYAVPAFGQSTTPQVAIDPAAELVNAQYVDVAVSGEQPNFVVRIRECPSTATQISQCKQDSQSQDQPGDQRVINTGPDGSGSTPFPIAAGDLTDQTGTKFRCDRDNPCELDAFQLNSRGGDLGFDHATRGPVGFAASTVPCAFGKSKSRVAGSGASAAAADVLEWESETCAKPYNLNVSYAVTNSPNGKQAFVTGYTDSDFAVSTIPLQPDELDSLKAAKRDVLQIPISVGSLAIVYDYYEIVNACNGNTVPQRITTLRMSPATVVGVLTGHITDMSDPKITADNPDLISQFRDANCQPVSSLPSRHITPVGRADNSGATFTLSSWAIANAKDAWEANGPGFKGGPTSIFPAGNGVDLRTGNAAVAHDVRSAGNTTDGAPDAAWFGYVDTSVARQLGLPSLAIKTSAGSWVAPTPDSVKAGIAAGTLDDDGTVAINYTPTDPNAYPLTDVSYLITDKAVLTKPRAATMKAFAAYAITKGQDVAEQRGFIPLSSDLQASASKQVDEIGPKVEAANSGDGGSSGSGSSGSGAGTGTTGPADSPSDGGPGSVGASDATTSTNNLADTLLASVGAGTSNPTAQQIQALSPIKGNPLATEALGPAGGPAGIVRSFAVLLGVPMLLVLGSACVALGFGDAAFAVVRRRVRIRGRRLSWRAK
jgi:phosphate transport system substrate-binding protein